MAKPICLRCGATNEPDAKFCPNCKQQHVPTRPKCPCCGGTECPLPYCKAVCEPEPEESEGDDG